jgi:glycosyltransferase involved in cell wall biosynthesis
VIQSKKVSVIIPNYNYGRYVGQAVDSVLKQTYRNFEVIVVNNGSTDDSIEILRTYGDKIRLIDQPNLGQSGARNSGLGESKGECIAFLDADDLWEPTKLEKQIKLMSEFTQLVYCGISQFGERVIGAPKVQMPKYKGKCMPLFLEQPGVSIVISGESTALFSRNLLNRVGAFDMKLNSTAGWDFFRRCSRNTEFDFVNEPLVNYRLHGNNMSNSHDSVIKDMRLAYSKLFQDSDWLISKSQELEVRRLLEVSFLKTYVKNFNLKSGFASMINLFQLFAKSA